MASDIDSESNQREPLQRRGNMRGGRPDDGAHERFDFINFPINAPDVRLACKCVSRLLALCVCCIKFNILYISTMQYV